jgi:BlaI family penicillinase repressor
MANKGIGMSDHLYSQLSRREHQIMNIVFEMGEATAAEIVERLPEPSSNASIRILLGILEEKGHLTHRVVGTRFVYRPTLEQEKAKRSALENLVRIFFGGSVTQVVATLLDNPELSETEREELARLIEEKKRDEG